MSSPPADRITCFLRASKRASNIVLTACGVGWGILGVIAIQLMILFGEVPHSNLGYVLMCNALAATTACAAGVRWMSALVSRLQLSGMMASIPQPSFYANGRHLTRVADQARAVTPATR